MRWIPILAVAAVATGCANHDMSLASSVSPATFARDRTGQPTSDLLAIRFRPGLCDGEELRPDYAVLDETNLIHFFERHRVDVRVERPRADLVYLSLGNVGTNAPVRLRVAVLKTPDEAGRDLHEAILQHGPGSWGVHRSNLAVLGPAGDPGDDIVVAAVTKLACWGVFTVAGTDDTFVVPGGYMEL